MPALTELNLYPGVPNTTRGEPTHIYADPSGASDNIVYPSGRVAVIRSISDPLSAKVFTQHTSNVTAAAFNRDGSLVASADAGGIVRIWEPNTLVQKAEFFALNGAIRDLAFDYAGKFIACIGDSRPNFAKVFKVPSGGSAGGCSGHTKRGTGCDISNSKPSFVATGGEDMTVGVFKGPPIREFDVPKFLKHHSAFVNDVKFSPDGKYLAIASSDKTVSVVDAQSLDVLVTLTGHMASVTGVCWAEGGSKLVTSANDKTTKVWTIPDGNCESTINYGSNVVDMQVGCTISRKGGEIVSASLKSEILVTDEGAAAPKSILRGHSVQIVGFAAVNDKIYSADYSGLLVAWDVNVGSSDLHFNGKGPVNAVCAIAANEKIVANVGQDGKIFVTPTNTLTFGKPLTVKGGGVGIAVPYTATGDFSAVMVNETRLTAVDPDGTSILAEMKFDNGMTGCCVATTSDGSLIAVGVQVPGESGELHFYTLSGSSFKKAGDVIRMPSAPNRAMFSRDDNLIAIGEKSRRVRIYNVTTRLTVTGGGIAHTARVDAICFSEDGTQIASGGMDGSVAVWPVDSEEDPIRLKMAHRSGVTGIAFTDAKTIVTCGGDSCMRSWNIVD